MLETAAASMRFSMSLMFGAPFRQRSLDRLIEGMLETRAELGDFGEDAAEMLEGPALDDETRRVVQGKRFRKQAVRAGTETAYYRELFGRLGIDPSRLTIDDVTRVPYLEREALRARPEDFVSDRMPAAIRAGTTGTTGWPISVYFSRREFHAIGSLVAMGYIMNRRVTPEDVVHLAVSSRATVASLGQWHASSAIGAATFPVGLVEPEHALALLATPRRLPGKKERVSVLSTYPSYLGQLVECGLDLGYRPTDFGLERVIPGGEILTRGMRERATELFGPLDFPENYGTTEVAPLGGPLCSARHLHFDASTGLAEVRDLEADGPAEPGMPGTLVLTAFRPYRETTPLLRYDTEDVVHAVQGPLDCELRTVPAVGDVIGKKRLSVRHDDGWTFLRDVVEALECVPHVRLPARYGFWPVPGGVAVEAVVRAATPSARRAVGESLEARQVPVRALTLVEDPWALRQPVPLRCDLRETSFVRTTVSHVSSDADQRAQPAPVVQEALS